MFIDKKQLSFTILALWVLVVLIFITPKNQSNIFLEINPNGTKILQSITDENNNQKNSLQSEKKEWINLKEEDCVMNHEVTTYKNNVIKFNITLPKNWCVPLSSQNIEPSFYYNCYDEENYSKRIHENSRYYCETKISVMGEKYTPFKENKEVVTLGNLLIEKRKIYSGFNYITLFQKEKRTLFIESNNDSIIEESLLRKSIEEIF